MTSTRSIWASSSTAPGYPPALARAPTYHAPHGPRARGLGRDRPVRPGALARTARPPGARVPHPAGRGAGPVLRGGRVPALRQGSGLLRPHPLRGRLDGQPQPAALLLGPGHGHPRHADRDRRVLRLDDLDGRPPPLPPALDRGQGVHTQGRQPDRGVRPREGRRHRRHPAREVPGRRLRLRRRGGGPAAAPDHLRDDGHPRRGRAPGLRVDEHHPRRRRPRLRGRLRRPPRAEHGHERLRHRARHGPPGQPPRRPDHRARCTPRSTASG